jgi:ankyrin repeat protein
MNKFKERIKDAICNNDIDFLKKNINSKNLNDRFEDENNDTFLMYSISDYGSKMFTFFMDSGADISLLNNEGENILHSAVYSNDIVRMEYVLSNFDIDINSQTNEGVTPLLLSLLTGNITLYPILVKYNSNINICDFENNYPIHVACNNGYFEIVKDLVARGALLNVRTKKGNFPISLAINSQKSEIVKFLFQKVYG